MPFVIQRRVFDVLPFYGKSQLQRKKTPVMFKNAALHVAFYDSGTSFSTFRVQMLSAI